MTKDLKVGDIVRVKSIDEIGVSAFWTSDLINGSCVKIVSILGAEIYVESLGHPEISRQEKWWFWPNEVDRDDFMTAVHRRRHEK